MIFTPQSGQCVKFLSKIAGAAVAVSLITASPAYALEHPFPSAQKESFEATPALTGAEGLLYLAEKEDFKARVIVTTDQGVRKLLATRKISLKKLLAQNGLALKNLVTSQGSVPEANSMVENSTTILLFGQSYNSDFEEVQLLPPTVETTSDAVAPGEEVIIEAGSPGLALKTVVTVDSLNNKGKSKTTEILTVVVAPVAEKVLVSDGSVTEETPTTGAVPLLSYPVAGDVTSEFGMRVHPITGVYKLHDGVDFGASCGTPVYATAAGVVEEVAPAGAYGNRVIVDHGNGFTSSYNHLSTFSVEVGQAVTNKSEVGTVGSTGYSTGCHLHFMTLQDDEPLDPLELLTQESSTTP